MNQSPPPPLTSRDFVPAPPAPAPSPAVATDWTERYVVRAGDSLSGIAKKLYGDARRYPEIVAANRARLRRGHLIFPGQELVIPRRPAEPARNRP